MGRAGPAGVDQRAQFDRAPRARTGEGGSVRREGDLIWLAARRNGRLRRERQAVAQRDDLDGPAGRGAGHIHGAARDPRGLLPPGGNQPEFFARGVQSAVGERRGAGRLRKAARLMPPGSFVVQEATGLSMVDYSNASSLALLDPRTRKWSDAILDAAGLDAGMFPELAPGTLGVGSVTEAFAAATGLSRETCVVVGCGDEMAATLGAGVFSPGEVCDVVGTAEPVCAVSATPREDGTMLVECHPHGDPESWLLENPGFVSGGNLRWWRDQFCPVEREAESRGEGDAYDLLSGPAASVAAGAEGALFLPCMQGAMAPEWNGAARGVFYGLTLAHTKAHLTRALLEGSAFALRDILEAMKKAGLEVRRLTIVGGGAKGALWRQIKADVTGLPVRVPQNVETTATGAAILAAVGCGLLPNVASAAGAFVQYRTEEHLPDPERHDIYDEAYRRYRDVYFALKPVFERA